MTALNGMVELPTDPEARVILAGEYVLGTLDARTAQAVLVAMASGDKGLAQLVQEFEARLTPLVAMSTPEAPPPDLWSRIEAKISPPAPALVARRRSRVLRLWQGWAVGASLAAAVLAGIAFLPEHPAGPVMTTVLLADANQTAWQAAIDQKGELHLAALSSVGDEKPNVAPAGHDFQMWAMAPGSKTPVSLGVVPHGSARVAVNTMPVAPVPGMLILISLEPPGGAPGASPTGPVVFIGRLSEAGPPT